MQLQSSPFCSLPRTVLELIALYTVDALGPPREILPLLLTCRALHDVLSFQASPHLYASIFRFKFDFSAAPRRLGRPAAYPSNLAKQLKTYCTALRALRTADVHDPALLETLWTAFFMMIENDGRNAVQLMEYADLKRFVHKLVEDRLWEHPHSGWPQGSTANALVLWLLWFVTDLDDITSENEEQRKRTMDLVRPFVINPVRYPTFHAAAAYFSFPVPLPEVLPPIVATPHGPAPPRHPGTLSASACAASVVRSHYGQRVSMCAPLASVAAKLIYVSRSEEVPVSIPEEWPEDRAQALALGHDWVHPTKADLREFNAHRAARPMERGAWERTGGAKQNGLPLSVRFDDDWTRWRHCFDMRFNAPLRAPYTPGSLTGTFFGRSMIPDDHQYFEMLSKPLYKPAYPMMSIVPTSIRVREYLSTGEPLPLPQGNPHQRDWFPQARHQQDRHGAMRYEVDGAAGTSVHEYSPYSPEARPACAGDGCAACEARGAARAQACEQTRQVLAERQRQRQLAADAAAQGERQGVRRSARLAARRERARAHDHDHEQTGVEREPLLQMPADDDVGIDKLLVEEMQRMAEEQGGDAGCTGVRDIVLVGESLPRHGQAWHRFGVRGRVRPWDGLCAFVRVHEGAQLPTVVFRGYVVGGQYLVGTWRSQYVVAGMHAEGPFVLSRIDG